MSRVKHTKSRVKHTKGRLSVDFSLHYDCWSDPGDYPSGAGSGPLPDGPPYVDEIDGQATYRLGIDDRWSLAVEGITLAEFVADIGVEIPGVIVLEWEVKASGDTLTFWPDKFETDEYYQVGRDEPDDSDFDRDYYEDLRRPAGPYTSGAHTDEPVRSGRNRRKPVGMEQGAIKE